MSGYGPLLSRVAAVDKLLVRFKTANGTDLILKRILNLTEVHEERGGVIAYKITSGAPAINHPGGSILLKVLVMWPMFDYRTP